MRGNHMPVNWLIRWMVVGMLIGSGAWVSADPVTEVEGDLEVTGVAAVGTSSPDAQHRLHVKGRVLAENGSTSNGTGRNEGLSLWTDEAFGIELHYSNSSWQTAVFGRRGDSTALTLGAYDGTISGDLADQEDFYHYLTIENSGEVGIGTESPDTNVEIDIGSNVAKGLLLEQAGATTNSARLFFRGYDPEMNKSNTILRTETRLSFRTGATVGTISGTERMSIGDDGKVGIGTTPDPTYDAILDVNGKIRLRDSADFDSAGTGNPTIWAQDDSGTSRIYARDESLNKTILSSHKDPREVDVGAISSFADTEVELPFSFAHSNPLIGKGAVVDMARAISDLESLTGRKYTYVYDISPENVVDYADWRQTVREQREYEAKMEILAASPSLEVPIAEALETVEILEATEVLQPVTRFSIDYEAGEIVEYVTDEVTVQYVATGQFETRLKTDHWFDEKTGRIYRERTLADVQVEAIPAPELPAWIVERLPKP